VAALAPTTLSAADHALIVLPPGRALRPAEYWTGTQRVSAYRVQIRENDGEPVLTCRRDGAVHLAAVERSVASLTVPALPGGLLLRLTGRLDVSAPSDETIAVARCMSNTS
jgi:hypothetical protein